MYSTIFSIKILLRLQQFLAFYLICLWIGAFLNLLPFSFYQKFNLKHSYQSGMVVTPVNCFC